MCLLFAFNQTKYMARQENLPSHQISEIEWPFAFFLITFMANGAMIPKDNRHV